MRFHIISLYLNKFILYPKIPDMKKILLSLFLIAAVSYSNAQTDEDYEEVARQTCACLSQKEITKDNIEMVMGVCILDALSKNEHFKDIDWTDEEEMEKIGERVGFKMILFCPEFFVESEAFQEYLEEQPDEDDTRVTGELEGKMVNFEKDGLMYVILIDDNNRKHKLLWLTPFDGDGFLTDQLGKKVKFQYVMLDIYEPRLNEYVSKKVITKAEY